MKVLIHQRNTKKHHTTDWSFPWAEYCRVNKIQYDIIDLFQVNAIDILKQYNVLLWHFSGYIYEDMLEARSILNSAKLMGLKVFPDYFESWHFDDKVAETYALQAVGAPIPVSSIFYDINTFENWLKNSAQLPIVGKLRTGSGSHNVKLFSNKGALKVYAKKMLDKGFNPVPSLIFKASSNIKSSGTIKTFISRAKRIPEFLRTLKSSKMFPNEKGYVFLQEFIPNDGYDLKIVVVSEKLSFIGRNIRKGEFRASGGGDLFFDRKYVTKDIIDSAFATSDALKFKCMGYDYVVNNITGEPKIVEISYGFSHAALLLAGGYFDRKGMWHDEPLNAPQEILKNLLDSLNDV